MQTLKKKLYLLTVTLLSKTEFISKDSQIIHVVDCSFIALKALSKEAINIYQHSSTQHFYLL